MPDVLTRLLGSLERARVAVLAALVIGSGILTWTFTTHRIVIWAALALQGVVAATLLGHLRGDLRLLARLGTGWLGLAYWVFGVAGAVLVGHLGVAVQRLVYTGIFGLTALAAVAVSRGGTRSLRALVGQRSPADRPGQQAPHDRQDLSYPLAIAALGALAVLLIAGSPHLFDVVHATPATPSAQAMRDRFWGGLGLFYHPNSMAGLAVAAAIRLGADRRIAAWQRLAAVLTSGVILMLTGSRIGLVFAAAAAAVHAIIAWRGRDTTQRDSAQGDPATNTRGLLLRIAIPFAVLALVVTIAPDKFFFASRFAPPAGSAADLTSGRLDTWRQVGADWRHAGWAEKLLGDANSARGVVVRTNDGAPPGTPHAKLNTDSAAVGSLRRGGVLGAIAFALGLLLLLVRALPWPRDTSGLRPRARPRWLPPPWGVRPRAWLGRRVGRAGRPPEWFTVAAFAAVPTIATEDWMLGGVNGFLWMLLLAGEAATLAFSPAAEALP